MMTPLQASAIYRGKLTTVWKQSPMYHAAKARAWVRTGVTKCEKCGTEANSRLFDVDHIEPKVAPGQDTLDLALFAARLNCPVTGLQVICADGCHRNKTALENSKRTGTRQKRVIQFKGGDISNGETNA